MSFTDSPAWRAYKAALHQLAAASGRVADAPQDMAAEEAFQDALRAYHAAREGLNGTMHLDGQVTRIIGLEAGRTEINLRQNQA